MCVEVTPPQLHIDPVLVAGCAVEDVLALYTENDQACLWNEQAKSYVGDKRGS
jgi:hypothetical protein